MAWSRAAERVLLSWYGFIDRALFTVADLIIGGVDTGWTFYAPLCTTFSNPYVVPALIGLIVVGFSSIPTGLNFIVPIFVWTPYAVSLIFLPATPVITIALVLLVMERRFGIGVFDPRLSGAPVLFEHLFWFYSHPAVQIMVLPGMGVISEVVPARATWRRWSFQY